MIVRNLNDEVSVMTYYVNAKKSKDGQPIWESYLSLMLQVIQDKPEWKSRQLKMATVDRMGLPDDLREKNYGNTKYDDNIAENRAGFALSLLKIAGLVDFLGAAKYTANEKGNQFLKQHQGMVTEKAIKQLSAYQAHEQLLVERKKNKTKLGNEALFEISDNDLPAELEMRNLESQYNESVANELLERIWQMESYEFEKLVVSLLAAMGYKGDNGQAFVTRRSNDGGIDGVLNQDPLGTQTVYVQAKRYSQQNTVQRPEISSFYGAIAETHSNKGVFMTSSSFSKGALATAKQLGIITIDGVQLTDLMVQYQIGVRLRYQYQLYDVDEDFFNIE